MATVASSAVDILEVLYNRHKTSKDPFSTKLASASIGTVEAPDSATFFPHSKEKTHYAEIYGPWVNLNQDIQDERYQQAQEKSWYWAWKSGLTPLLHPDSPYDMLNFPAVLTWPQALEGKVQNWLHQHQKLNMGGFSSAALHRWGAVNIHVKDPRGRLHNAIHPVVEKDRWGFGKGVDIQGMIAKSGNSDMTDKIMKEVSAQIRAEELIWECLDPALRLVSNYLTHSCCVPWVDACLKGERKVVPDTEDWIEEEDRVLEILPCRSFYRRRRHEAAKDGLDGILKELNDMAPYVRLEVCLKEMKDTKAYGMTQLFPTPDGKDIGYILIRIQNELIVPLVGDTLTPSQRVIVLWGVVHTVLHEFGHALNLWRDYQDGLLGNILNSTVREPYFEREVLNEMGYSFTNALFGGISNGINMDSVEIAPDSNKKVYYPTFAFLHTPWPYPGKASFTGMFLGPPNKEIFDALPTDSWSLSVDWLASLFDDTYWESVRACEGQNLKFPRQQGYRSFVGDPERFKHIRSLPPATSLKDIHSQRHMHKNAEAWIPCDTNMFFALESIILARGLFGMADADGSTWGLPQTKDLN